MYRFPNNFIWGAATSSYQIEGGAHEDDKVDSIWDRFCNIPGKVANFDTGEVAIDHYHRFPEDIQLMKDLNIQSYRFSVSWPRLYSETPGKFNQKGLDFYKRLTDHLLEAGIDPMLTLYHWDLPQPLQEKGGWENRDTVEHFREYAVFLYESLGSCVNRWITHNEPWVASYLGYGAGEHAPGIQNFSSFLTAAHHILLSHGEAVQAFRECGPDDGEIGITLNLTPSYPSDQSKNEAKQAARVNDGFINRWFLDPVLNGHYPEDMQGIYQNYFPASLLMDGDLSLIHQPIDFLGVNYYSTHSLKSWHHGESEPVTFEYAETGRPVTDMNWAIHSDGLYDLLVRIQQEYGSIPLFITENGAAFKDQVEADGTVKDGNRVAYLKEHLASCHRAIEAGVDLRGYYVWSFFDNFEWAFGYDKRFGIVYVNYGTLKRMPKQSAGWYKKTIASNGF